MSSHPCERCDFIGPELPGAVRDARELHRLMHSLVGIVADALAPLTDWQMRVLDQVAQARADDVRFSLTLPRSRWMR